MHKRAHLHKHVRIDFPISGRARQEADSTIVRAALTNCENKVTFSERSYAHCSMYRYVHPRTHICACASHFMEGSVRLSLSKHYTPQLGASVPSSEAFAVPGPSTPQLGAVVPSPATPKLPVTVNLAYLGSFCLGCRMVILLETRART